MATATQTGFNYDLFKKRVKMFDSDRDGERNVAISQALRQCAEHDPPLLFYEAMSGAFGEDNDADQDRLKADFSELKSVASRLNGENSRLLQEIDRLRLMRSASEWPPAWFVQPKPLLFALGIAVAMEWLLLLPFWELPERDTFLLIQWAHTICAALFLLWSLAVFKCEGSKRLAFGWPAWGGSWFALIAIHAFQDGGFHWDGFRIGVIAAPLHWWSAVGFGAAGDRVTSALIVLASVIDIICGAKVLLWLKDRLIQWTAILWEFSVFLFGELRKRLVDE
ncbi:hypothetical protein [Acidicapsa ligni]|uniref:hypothetical protein n=1 Tax=Acidicapsa ligni TaxID=542300 RepID=UPI0021DFF594|nr:hypothetical protein [Acidicapsa ligni]